MITMQFEGGKELADALGQLSPRVSRKVQKEALMDAAEPMRRRMEQLAPRAPGKPDLADHMVISSERGVDAQEVVVAVGPSKSFFYGSFQELGTAHHPAHPFARPAFDQKAESALKLFADAVWLALTGRGVRRATVLSDAPVSGPGRLV